MNSIANPLAPRTNRLLSKSAQIKDWVRELLSLPEDTHLSVAQLACQDEGCPDVETVIGVFETGRPANTIRVHLPILEVTEVAIRNAMAGDA